MSERPSHFPELPELHRRTEFVPLLTAAAHSLPAEQKPEAPAPSEATAPPAPAEAGERSRITLAGRVGAAPRLRTTPKQRLIAQFPLGVRGDDDKTTWHQVLAFDARAEQVRDTLNKGDAVEVIGYRHERQLPRRGGGVRTLAEIYATVIKPR